MKPWELVGGLVGDNQCTELHRVASSLLCPALVVEIGSYKGKSTIAIASGIVGRGKVLSIDPFCDYELDDGAMFFSRYGNPRADFLRNIENSGFMSSVECYPEIPEWVSPTLDMVFLDGDHRYLGVKNDFNRVYPLLRVRGYMIMHDVGSHDGVTRLWSEKSHLFDNITLCDNMVIGRKL